MGNLKPGGTYIYERVDNTVFRREAGQTEREVVGYDHRTTDGRPLVDHIREDKLWGEIRQAAKTNTTLQAELDRVIMLYYLINEDKSNSPHHPV